MSGDDAVVFFGLGGILCLALLAIEFVLKRIRYARRVHRLRAQILQRDRDNARRLHRPDGEHVDGLARYFGADSDDDR